jgi:hypothetical protein
MARAIIKLINDGIDENGKLFSAVSGTYTFESNVYTFGVYKFHSTNVASVYIGLLPEEPRIQKLLIVD